MLEGLALLIFIYALTVFLPAFGKLRNLLAGPLGGIVYRSVIRYQPEKGPVLELFFRDHNLLMSKRYSLGDSVEVTYDADAPHRAFPVTDWKAAFATCG